MSKIVFVALFAAVLAMASAASFGGAKDFAGNYYDYSTGQLSSSLTGKVYNTAAVGYVPHVAPVVAAAPYYYGTPYYGGHYGVVY